MMLLVENPKHQLVKNVDIFYKKEFFDLHTDEHEGYYFGIANNSPQNLIGGINIVFFENGYAKTPIRGTYGGFYFEESFFSIVNGEEVLNEIEKWLVSKKVKTFEITLPPFSHGSEVQIWFNILLRSGFSISSPDINYEIHVTKENFESRVNRACLKKLNQISKTPLYVRSLQNDEFENAYKIIQRNREKKERKFSMSFDAIMKMYKVFPEELLFFGAFEGENLRASAICLRLKKEILYVFAWGDDGELASITPTTLLAKSLYEWCQFHQVNLLDLGISTEKGIPNYGLINYKKSLGAAESLKLTLSKNYE